MSVEILTKQDLEDFKGQLIQEIKDLLLSPDINTDKWMRSSEIRRFLKISPGTLQTLRVKGLLPYTKIGGVIFYNYRDVLRMLEGNKFQV